MALSNTAVPKYYGQFREKVIRGEIPVCKEVSMEMNRIDDLIANPGIYYDDKAVEGWIKYCESEMTLTDGSDLHLLDTFKLWGEQVFGWYYFVERTVYEPNSDGHGGHYVKKMIKKRLINKQYLIVGRGAAKSVYDSCIQSFYINDPPNHNSPHNEIGRRGYVPYSHRHYKGPWPIVPVLDRGISPKHYRFQGQSCEIGLDQKGN